MTRLLFPLKGNKWRRTPSVLITDFPPSQILAFGAYTNEFMPETHLVLLPTALIAHMCFSDGFDNRLDNPNGGERGKMAGPIANFNFSGMMLELGENLVW